MDVPSAGTIGLAPGNYRDYLRVTLADGSVLTEWTGIIRAAPPPASPSPPTWSNAAPLGMP
jgi:hypothetical protein